MRIILLLEEGASYSEIREQLGAFLSTISRWKQRFEQDGLLGLATIHPSQPPQKRHSLVPRCWRRPGEYRRTVLRLIARIWKDADLMPHRLER